MHYWQTSSTCAPLWWNIPSPPCCTPGCSPVSLWFPGRTEELKGSEILVCNRIPQVGWHLPLRILTDSSLGFSNSFPAAWDIWEASLLPRSWSYSFFQALMHSLLTFRSTSTQKWFSAQGHFSPGVCSFTPDFSLKRPLPHALRDPSCWIQPITVSRSISALALTSFLLFGSLQLESKPCCLYSKFFLWIHYSHFHTCI